MERFHGKSATNAKTQIKYHEYISSRSGERRKTTNISPVDHSHILFHLILSFFNRRYTSQTIKGDRIPVANFINTEKIKLAMPETRRFLRMRRNADRAKNIITTSLCAETRDSMTTRGFSAKKARGNVFLFPNIHTAQAHPR